MSPQPDDSLPDAPVAVRRGRLRAVIVAGLAVVFVASAIGFVRFISQLRGAEVSPAGHADGIVVLDAYGQAEITLPGTFSGVNQDIRYQLTPLGAYAPLFIASEWNGNTFRIGGGTPGLRVSWAVTGTQNRTLACKL